MKQTIFERYGGFANVSRVVSSFYNKILDSSITAPYFAHTHMKRLIDHQTKFIASIMGGPASFTNDYLEKVHERLNISEEAFMEAAYLLGETLEDFNFEDEDIRLVKQEFVNRKNHIVKRG
jgi:hemoglobin